MGGKAKARKDGGEAPRPGPSPSPRPAGPVEPPAPPCAPSAPRPRRAGRRVAALLLVLAGAAAFANSFTGFFLFDDGDAITENPYVQHLWPLWRAMSAPPETTVSGRPMVSLSLAISYATSELNPVDYHAFNLAIHLLAGLTLFGILRRTLLLEGLRERFGPAATPLAFAAALLWMVHPLQTESVTYVVQRAESMMGLALLLTLYCAIRGWASPYRLWWFVGAVAACAIGMGCKEVMAVAPAVVLLYDRCFVAGRFRTALRRSWGLYVALAATWGILAALMIASPRGASAGFGNPHVTAWQYARSQPGIILYYLRLAFVPRPLVLDYAWPIAARVGEILPQAAGLAVLAGLTVWAMGRRRPPGVRAAGFAGGWFLLILSPTSSFLPIADLAFEHRMYLPLAAVTAGVVIVAYLLGGAVLRRLPGSAGAQRAVAWVVAVLALCGSAGAMGCLTLQRNADYGDRIRMWRVTSEQSPQNWRAHLNYGDELFRHGRPVEAEVEIRRSIALKGDNPAAWNNLAASLYHQGRQQEAVAAIERARVLSGLNPSTAEGYYNLGLGLAMKGLAVEAIPHFRRAIEMKPNYAAAYAELGTALLQVGDIPRALACWREALRIQDNLAPTLNNLAWLESTWPDESVRNGPEAVALAQRACQASNNAEPQMLATLAAAFAETGQFSQAVETLQRAIRLAEDRPDKTPPPAYRQMLAQFQQGKAFRQARPSAQTAPAATSPAGPAGPLPRGG